MFSGGIIELLKHVITSWQVIFITLVFIIYVFIVNNAARRYRRPRIKKTPKIKKPKPESASGKKKKAKSDDEIEIEEQ